jgi:hypothetical protein
LLAGKLGSGLTKYTSRRQNGKDIGGKCPPRAVILPARIFGFEIEAILASFEVEGVFNKS